MMQHSVISGTDRSQFETDLNIASKEGWSVHTFHVIPGQAATPDEYVALVVRSIAERKSEGMGSKDKPLAAK
jgi:hypothetical protein